MARSSSSARSGSDVKLAFGAAVVLALVASLINDGTLGWFVAPVVILLALYAVAKAPLRDSLLVLTFFALTLENPGENPGAGIWRTPWFPVGALLLARMNRLTGESSLFFSGMDLILGTLILVTWYRRSSRAPVDGRPSVPFPKPLVYLAFVSLGGTAYGYVSGILRSGDGSIALTQMDRVFYLPVVFLLFQAGLRGTQDYLALGKVVVLAAVWRSLQAAYVMNYAPLPLDANGMPVPPAYATTHHDSMLFAWASVMVIALIIQRIPSSLRVMLTVMPVLVAGMLYNDRRMVWVQILMVFAILYFATPPNAVKRKIRNVLLLFSPAILGYVVAGWNSKAGVFKPVQTIRSAVDSEVDDSTLWRDIENFDLIWTIRQNPIFGSGYGHGFIEFIPLPPVDYALERFVPHNSVLGLLAYTGLIGYTAMTLLWVGGVYFAVRAYLAASKPYEKAAALAAMGAVPIYYLQCYGDMGLGSWTGVFMMAPAIATAGQLAVATGAWPARSLQKKAAPAETATAHPAGSQVSTVRPSATH